MIHVIGAGPSGSIAAISALRAGHEVTVSEEHPRAGIPENCSGLFSRDGLESLSSFFDYRKTVLNNIYGAHIYLADTKLSVRKEEPVGYVCSRASLDSLLASNAESEGVSVRYGHRVHGSYLSDTVIGADGPVSSVASQFSMGRIARYASTMQATLPYKAVDPHMVEVFLSSERFPGFFGWIIPQDEYTADVGVGVLMPNNALRSWEHMLKLKGLEWTKPRGWSIPLGCRQTTGKRKGKHKILLVGDAAGQVKATTGGGVIFGGNCASIAGKHTSNPELYEIEWRARYGPDLSMHSHISNYLSSLSDEELSALGRKLNRMNCGEFLSNHGHMDKPTKMLGPGIIAHLIKNIAGVS